MAVLQETHTQLILDLCLEAALIMLTHSTGLHKTLEESALPKHCLRVIEEVHQLFPS
jgi:hypothetical protein